MEGFRGGMGMGEGIGNGFTSECKGLVPARVIGLNQCH